MQIKITDILFSSFILITLFIYFHFYNLNVDTTWGLYCAKKILNASKMYVDMIDVNPPLIFLYYTVPVYISDLLNISIKISFLIFILILCIISIYLSYKILYLLKFKDKRHLKYYIYCISFVLIILPNYDFGEREHFFIIFILPYLLMKIYKDSYNIISIKLKILITVYAIFGFNLKPHFFLIVLLIELFNILSKKRILEFFKIDTILLIISIPIYIYLIYLFFPEYIEFIIPFSLDVYVDVFNKSLYLLLLNYEIILFIITIAIFLIITEKRFSYENIQYLIIILSTLIIYLIQQKGWSYHRLPFFVMITMFCIHLYCYLNLKNKQILFSLFPFILYILYINVINVYNYKDLKEKINLLPDDSRIIIFTTDIAQGQPLLKESQNWVSRFPSLFMLPSIINKNNKNVEIYMLNAIYEDLKKYKPNYIIFPTEKLGFDYYKYLNKKNSNIENFYKKDYRMIENNNYIILEKKN